MKTVLRGFLINLAALWFATTLMPGLAYTGGVKTLLLGSLGIMLVNLAIIPLLKFMFLPINLITMGIFTWVLNVIGLFFLTKILPQFQIIPYNFEGSSLNGIILPPISFNVLMVAIISSFLIGFSSRFLHWLSK